MKLAKSIQLELIEDVWVLWSFQLAVSDRLLQQGLHCAVYALPTAPVVLQSQIQ